MKCLKEQKIILKALKLKKDLFNQKNQVDLGQWFLTFFVPWTPKSQNNFHGPSMCYFVLMADPFIPVKEV